MRFLNRNEEMARLDAVLQSHDGGLVVLYGRRRIGKTRLLLEWISRRGGLYVVADQSSADVQRGYFARAVAQRLAGFDDVVYPDWRALLSRLAREASQSQWRGPLVIDELPYLVQTSPELPSVLQQWIDHEVREAKLTVAIAGSSQRMMQGLVLDTNAPLYGRAKQLFPVNPLEASWLQEALSCRGILELVENYAAWGGVPRYWELAAGCPGPLLSRIDELILNPAGPLHGEPDRLLIEELPPALELRPILDAIGMGAHRISEIASRMGHRPTSLSRPMRRLVDLGLVRREAPFGEPEKAGRRCLYKIADPFVRLWFRVVASNRAFLATATPGQRQLLHSRHWETHVAGIWEDLVRDRLPSLQSKVSGAAWEPASRWWHGNEPEWDIVSRDRQNGRLLLAEVKWSSRPFTAPQLEKLARELSLKRAPTGLSSPSGDAPIRIVVVPEVDGAVKRPLDNALLLTGAELFDLRDIEP